MTVLICGRLEVGDLRQVALLQRLGEQRDVVLMVDRSSAGVPVGSLRPTCETELGET